MLRRQGLFLRYLIHDWLSDFRPRTTLGKFNNDKVGKCLYPITQVLAKSQHRCWSVIAYTKSFAMPILSNGVLVSRQVELAVQSCSRAVCTTLELLDRIRFWISSQMTCTTDLQSRRTTARSTSELDVHKPRVTARNCPYPVPGAVSSLSRVTTKSPREELSQV